MTELVVGRIAKSHGLDGEVAVEIRTDEPELRFAVGATLIARVGPPGGGRDRAPGALRTLTVRSVREHSSRLLVTFEDVADRNAADQLRGALLLVRSDELPPSEDPDEFYDHELIDLTVIDQATGQTLGAVSDVVHGRGGEWLVMRREDGREALIPFVAAIVVEVSRAEGVARIVPPEGLFEL